MATPGRTALKVQKQTQSILKVVNELAIKITTLTDSMQPVELSVEEVEFDDHIPEQLEAIKTNQSNIANTLDIIVSNIAILKQDVNELKPKKRGRKPIE